MADRVGRREDIAEALLRVLIEDLEEASRDLGTAGSREERIHRTRQRLKRARTILNALEPTFGERALAARKVLTEAARLLAKARDADVAAARAHDLAVETADGDDLGFDRVAAALDEEAARAHHERTPVAEVNRRLAKAIGVVGRFDADFDGAQLIEDAVRQTYKRGRKAMRTAEASLATPDLHRWRKAVKRLAHLIRIARKRLPKRVVAGEAVLDRLGDVLGLDNDHAMLAEKLALSPTAEIGLMRQLAVIAKRRSTLEKEAFAIGRVFYKRPPARFLRRLRDG